VLNIQHMMLIFQHNLQIQRCVRDDSCRGAVTSSSRDVTGTIPPVTRVGVAAIAATRPNQIQRALVQAFVNVGECK
jgi:hypothetical protein